MNRKSLFTLFSLLAIFSLLLSACAAPTTQPAAPTNTPAPTAAPTGTPAPTATAEPTATPQPTAVPVTSITLTDDRDAIVELAGPAQRVVSLAPSITEVLYAVGAGKQVVGRDEFSDYPAEAMELPSMGGSYGDLNIEAIVDAQPDLVLVADITSLEQIKSLEDAGLTVFYLDNPSQFDGLYVILQTVAQLTGHEAEAAALVDSLKVRVAAVQEKIATVTDVPSVFYELDATDPNAPYTVGKGTFIELLISMAGGKNIGSEIGDSWVQVSAEKLIELNPQVILLGDAAYGTTVEMVKARAGWDVLDAVKNDQIFTFDDDLVSRPGPRLVDGLETLARLLHPESFK